MAPFVCIAAATYISSDEGRFQPNGENSSSLNNADRSAFFLSHSGENLGHGRFLVERNASDLLMSGVGMANTLGC